MNVMLVNDDGIDAPGLAALYRAVTSVLEADNQEFSIIVVAPDRGRSECGHSVTNGRPLSIVEQAPGWFSVDGTPVDCVRIALSGVWKSLDCVISGINAGANLGVDLLVSGTFAAAREAALNGVPSLATSHYRKPEIPKTWDHAGVWLRPVLERFFEGVRSNVFSDGNRDRLWNVNLPALDPLGKRPPVVECPVDPTPQIRTYSQRQSSIQLATDFHTRPRLPGADVAQCFDGNITLSRLLVQPW